MHASHMFPHAACPNFAFPWETKINILPKGNVPLHRERKNVFLESIAVWEITCHGESLAACFFQVNRNPALWSRRNEVLLDPFRHLTSFLSLPCIFPCITHENFSTRTKVAEGKWRNEKANTQAAQFSHHVPPCPIIQGCWGHHSRSRMHRCPPKTSK